MVRRRRITETGEASSKGRPRDTSAALHVTLGETGRGLQGSPDAQRNALTIEKTRTESGDSSTKRLSSTGLVQCMLTRDLRRWCSPRRWRARAVWIPVTAQAPAAWLHSARTAAGHLIFMDLARVEPGERPVRTCEARRPRPGFVGSRLRKIPYSRRAKTPRRIRRHKDPDREERRPAVSAICGGSRASPTSLSVSDHPTRPSSPNYGGATRSRQIPLRGGAAASAGRLQQRNGFRAAVGNAHELVVDNTTFTATPGSTWPATTSARRSRPSEKPSQPDLSVQAT